MSISSIKGAVEQIARTAQGVDATTGKVISAAPIRIQLSNDDKMILSSSTLVVLEHLTAYQAECDVTLTIDGIRQLQHTTITVDNALKTGDLVWLLSYNHGKSYIVLGKVV